MYACCCVLFRKSCKIYVEIGFHLSRHIVIKFLCKLYEGFYVIIFKSHEIRNVACFRECFYFYREIICISDFRSYWIYDTRSRYRDKRRTQFSTTTCYSLYYNRVCYFHSIFHDLRHRCRCNYFMFLP